MDHFPKIRRPFLDSNQLSSPLAHESESESSDTSGSEAPSPPVRSSATFTPPLEQDGSLKKSQNVEPENNKGWYEFDLSVIVALVSPIGNWLTGGDYIKNVLLILLLIFYLHQLIEVPWSLYHLSRPRHRSPDVPLRQTSAEQEVLRQLASSELHALEMFYLSLTILSPLLGAALLRAVLIYMAGPEAISWFSTSLFIFATGLRPWKHAIERLRCRARDLHTIIHYPPASSSCTQVETLTMRVATLEAQLTDCKDAMRVLTEDIFDHVDGTVEGLERSIRKREKKNDTNHSAHESRLVTLEQNVEGLLEKQEISVQGPTATHNLLTSVFHAAVTEPLALLLPQWACSSRTDKLPPSPRPSPKLGRPRAATKLETIPEGAVLPSRRSRSCFPSFQIPGLKFVLRIGDLATLPVRRVVAFLLIGRIYAPHVPASSS